MLSSESLLSDVTADVINDTFTFKTNRHVPRSPAEILTLPQPSVASGAEGAKLAVLSGCKGHTVSPLSITTNHTSHDIVGVIS